MGADAEVEEQAPVYVIEAVVQAAKHFKRQFEFFQELSEESARASRAQKDEADGFRAKWEQCIDWLDKNATGLELDF